MKTLITAGLFALATTTAFAQPFAYQQQIGSTEYVPFADTEHLTFAPVEKSDFTPSLNRLIVEANVDGAAPNDFRGTIIKSGPSRISLYEIQRGSPEATANSGYYAQFPADTDWDRVARDYREQQKLEDVASQPHGDKWDS
ncbi:hypothetical protein [Thiosocius teredinicola]|uniref:hypothetical protein n=1 Tax=Thiosocius teredinicola TaxID=1973002 RepID=UPI0009911A56